jgi:hypothetical protein
MRLDFDRIFDMRVEPCVGGSKQPSTAVQQARTLSYIRSWVL